MTEFDKYYSKKIFTPPVDNRAIEEVDAVWEWVGKDVAITALMAAIGYVIGGML